MGWSGYRVNLRPLLTLSGSSRRQLAVWIERASGGQQPVIVALLSPSPCHKLLSVALHTSAGLRVLPLLPLSGFRGLGYRVSTGFEEQ